MLVEPVPIAPRSRRSTTAVLLVAAVPALVVAAAAFGHAAAAPDGREAALPARSAAAPAAEPPPSATTDPAGTVPVAAVRFPAEALGLPVHTVAGTLGRVRGGLVDGHPIAVGGFLTIRAPAAGCDAATGRATWNDACRPRTTLADSPAPIRPVQGDAATERAAQPAALPHLHPRIAPPASLRQVFGRTVDPSVWQGGTARAPLPVVLIGRFEAAPAGTCWAAGRHCGRSFVLERLAWSDGQWRGPVRVRDPALDGVEVNLGREEVAAILPPEAMMLSRALLGRDGLARVDPAAAQAVATGTGGPVWYVRLLRLAPARPTGLTPPSGGGPRVAWLVVDDATGAIVATGD